VRTPGTPGVVDGPRVHRWFAGPDEDRRSPKIGNVIVGAAVPVLSLAASLARDAPTARVIPTVAIALVVGIALSWLGRWPVQVLGVTLVGTVAALLVDQVHPVLVAASVVAVFAVASMRPRRVALVATAVSTVVLFGVARADVAGPVTEPRALIVVVWTVLAFAMGDAVRTQRAYMSALAERARRADETKEQEARARVAEERVRIARELHDVVAHHIAVINVHAGLARRALGRDAATVDASLGHVQGAAQTVLEELGTVLRVLRAEDNEGSATEPAPGLAHVPGLLANFSAAGFVVRTSTSGRPREMDQTCDLAAFRIVQESLTNASKHGAGAQADLSLTYGDDALTIDVRNLVRFDPAGVRAAVNPYGGQGLIGMRERAGACGGSLRVHPDDEGTFRLTAVIPYRPTPPSGSAVVGVAGPGRPFGDPS
jgi:signal transduction histidine kinase